MIQSSMWFGVFFRIYEFLNVNQYEIKNLFIFSLLILILGERKLRKK